jgi:hypothetical protein
MNCIKTSIIFIALILTSFFPKKLYSQWTTPIHISENLSSYSEESDITAAYDGKILFVWTQNYDQIWTKNDILFRKKINNLLLPIQEIISR